MWAKIVQAILLPLIQKSVVALYNWIIKSISEWKRKRKLKKDNEKKVKDYEEASNIDDANDSYNKLP